MFFGGHGQRDTPPPLEMHARHSLPAPHREGRGTIRAVPPELGRPISPVEVWSIGSEYARREAARSITPPASPCWPSTPAHDNSESHESSGTSGTERTGHTNASSANKVVKPDIAREKQEGPRLFSASSWSLALRKSGGFKRVKNALRAIGRRRTASPAPAEQPSAVCESATVEAHPAYMQMMRMERITTERDEPPVSRGHERKATFGDASTRAERAQTLYDDTSAPRNSRHTVRRKPVPVLGEDERPLMRARSVPHRPERMGMNGTSLPPPPRRRR
ncbi:hypothetical protein CC85DRAFT_286571 [Cutaneotrichosporon oleaginosum]|uniref:Uncharacterized protein n=1 Tax=Cutaneotrichosporon oleaginosum TaxID=879819 RepID=A0A0J0XJZ4_9TREE|nr:uncharacterized protein CC85DRAFT_286571 [Cutaneotrichosporon oleaginosum]KLT41393.1 hypothetical protein CC85DRAFT_286571 [Cutaneotrichosporon oleaginosum]TXT06334.1 hypothetical protein COLE_05665 [Cutaneotrichosporon oleaginosum]